MMKNEDALDNKFMEEILKPEPMRDTEGHFLVKNVKPQTSSALITCTLCRADRNYFTALTLSHMEIVMAILF
jgi:hypothetical protein